MHKSDRAVVLLSGGIDSAVCLWQAQQKWKTYTISFNYYKRLRREIEAAAALAKRAGVAEHKTIDLPFLREFRNMKGKTSNVKIPSAYVPGRNLIFYSIASYWADSKGAQYVVGGHNRNDGSNFPDSTPNFFVRLNTVMKIGMLRTRKPLEVIAPLAKLDKIGVLKEAIRLNVPIELTWSCYEREDMACGQCPACRARLLAFSRLHLMDPVPYVAR